MGSEGLKEEEVELELGLSLGGNYRRNVSKKEGEIQSLHKQEGKRKREENEMNNGFFKENDSDDSVGVKFVASQGNESGEKDFEEKSRRVCKKNKVNNKGLIQNEMGSVNQNKPVQYLYPYPYPYPEKFQGATGIVFPNGNGSLMPCWYGKEGNGVVNPVMSYGFVPFQAAAESYLVQGNELEQNGSRKEGKKKGGSAESSVRSSSGSSDRKSSSCEVGRSNDSRSHSICSLPEQCSGSKLSNTQSISEHSATSNLTSSSLVNETADHIDGLMSSNSSQSCLSGPKEAILETEPNHTNEGILTPANPTLGSSKEAKKEIGKPPKPQTQKQSTPPSFSFMPCVSTRGDGPDGKTINGFLHRYTKTEVSIICMCHGTSFSPAEFVQHAGGKDVSHPLRHITVMPPACSC